MLKWLAGELVDLGLQAGRAWAKSPDSRDRICRSTDDAAPLHAGERRDQRALQRLVDRGQPFGDEAGL